MPNKIQFKRGLEANLPNLTEGEPGFTTDSKKLFVGSNTGNVQFAKQTDLDATNALLAERAMQSITTTFNSDGSITETYASGLTKTTTFDTNGAITEVYSAPINKTKTMTFNSDGSISEVVS